LFRSRSLQLNLSERTVKFPAYLEFCQQRGNVKFNRSFREVELGSDLFVGATIRDAGKNFFFPASQPHLAMNGFSSLEQLVGLLDEIFENMVFCLDQNGIIAWSLAPNQTMH